MLQLEYQYHLVSNKVTIHEKSIDRSIAKDFIILKGGWVLAQVEICASLGDIYLVTLHRRVVRVMAVVRDLPTKVGGPEERMSNKTNDIVDGLVGREGRVTALVTNDPDTSEDETLEPPAIGDEISA
jgi:hypothetical protein